MKIHRRAVAISAAAALALGTALAGAPAAHADPAGAVYTVISPDVTDGSTVCQNGNPTQNCNLYYAKDAVFLNATKITPGEYVFAVVDPGGQNDPNHPLSTDDLSARHLQVLADGTVKTAGDDAHQVVGNMVQLMPFADTLNNGGVYQAVVCPIGAVDPATDMIDASQCSKSDNFKIVSQGSPITYAKDLTASKSVEADYVTTFGWSIDKSIVKCEVLDGADNLLGACPDPAKILPSWKIVVDYQVDVAVSQTTYGPSAAMGTVTVTNPNGAAVADVTLTEQGLDNGTACKFNDSAATTLAVDSLPKGDSTFAITCDSMATDPGATITNTVDVAWSEQVLDDGSVLAASSTSTSAAVAFVETDQVDESVTVTDSLYGPLGTVTVADAPKTITYPLTFTGKQPGAHQNIATYTTNDSGKTGTDDETVTVVVPKTTGGLTMGFWQGPNGQNIIKSTAQADGSCVVRAWLLTNFPNAFKDLATATSTTQAKGNGSAKGTTLTGCDTTAAWVVSTVNNATAKGTGQAQLEGQMMAAALNVYFSTHGDWSKYGLATSDLGKLMIDVTPQGATPSFGKDYDTLSNLLTYADANLFIDNKGLVIPAKDVFDAFNNNAAYGF